MKEDEKERNRVRKEEVEEGRWNGRKKGREVEGK